MATLELVHLRKEYKRVTAVKDLSLSVADGEMLALLGESGCGKTTTLRMIAGFETPTSGKVIVDGKELGPNVPAYKRNIGIFFQNYALFPHMSVYDNVAFGLRMRRVPPEETRKRVDKALAMVRLPDLGDEYPRRLSGGQQQRVALARALVTRPQILLLDEPLSNLDAKLRVEMQVEIKRIQRELGITTIIVTHDQEEAVSLAHRVAVMRHGEIMQLGTPEEVFDHPSSPFVADFMGFQTFLRGNCQGQVGDCVAFNCSGKRVLVEKDMAAGMEAGMPAILAIRSENISVRPSKGASEGEQGIVSGVIAHKTYRGHATRLEVTGAFAESLFPSIVGRCDLSEGDEVEVELPADSICVYVEKGQDAN